MVMNGSAGDSSPIMGAARAALADKGRDADSVVAGGALQFLHFEFQRAVMPRFPERSPVRWSLEVSEVLVTYDSFF
jgi:hypothetical protein